MILLRNLKLKPKKQAPGVSTVLSFMCDRIWSSQQLQQVGVIVLLTFQTRSRGSDVNSPKAQGGQGSTGRAEDWADTEHVGWGGVGWCGVVWGGVAWGAMGCCGVLWGGVRWCGVVRGGVGAVET